MITVISAISGGYDTIWEDQVFTCPYVMFSDQQSDKWSVRKPFQLFSDPNRNAKIPKILSHKFSGEYSLWIDGNISILRDPNQLINEYLDGYDICFFKHPVRNCVYKELEELILLGLDDTNVMNNQIQRYIDGGYPQNNGLHAGSVILRRHTPQVIEFNNLWWSEVTTGSRRDQLSLDYCLWKTGLKPRHFDGYHQPHYGVSELFVSRSHK